MAKRAIIETALENLEHNTGLKGIWHPDKGIFDGEIEWLYNDEVYQIPLEIKNQVERFQVGNLIEQKRQLPALLVAADYINPMVKETLRAEGIGYLETNGNVFLKTGPLFLWIDNIKTIPREKKVTGRAFAKTGLKLLFHFLLEEDVLNLTYRDIAQRTGIGFGNLNFIITDLKQQGFLLNINKDVYKLTRKQELLQRWVRAYEEKLKPTLEIGTFRFVNQDNYFNWKEIHLLEGNTFWGGEPAGGIITNYLQPQQYTLYTTETRGNLMRNYQLVPDKEGDIKVYQKFWQLADEEEGTVPPLLVYADLINSNDRRCLQTAEKIYNGFLQDKFRAD